MIFLGIDICVCDRQKSKSAGSDGGYSATGKSVDVHQRFVSSRRFVSHDQRGHTRARTTLFSYFPRVSRSNRQQHCFSLALPFPSHTPLLPALSPSIWRLAFGIPFLILGHTEDLLPRTRRGPLVMTATLQCTRRPELHNRMLQRTRRMHLAAYPTIVRWISLTFYSQDITSIKIGNTFVVLLLKIINISHWNVKLYVILTLQFRLFLYRLSYDFICRNICLRNLTNWYSVVVIADPFFDWYKWKFVSVCPDPLVRLSRTRPIIRWQER